MGDASHWIYNIANRNFPGTIQIVNLYHARELHRDSARKLYPTAEFAEKRWLMANLDWLENSQIEALATILRKPADGNTMPSRSKLTASGPDRNRGRMPYQLACRLSRSYWEERAS